MESKLVFVKVNGMLFVGKSSSATGIYDLENPRVIISGTEQGSIALSQLPGNPSTMKVTGIQDFSYENEDTDFLGFYTQEINGVTE